MPDAEAEGPDIEAERATGPDANAFGLEVEGLIVDGEDGRRLLDVPALSVAPGEFTCITGPSGAGKSTLLFALAGLTPVARGTILWGGEDLAALGDAARTRWRAAHAGLVFQDFLLFDEIGPLANASLGGAWRSRRERAAIESRARELLAWLGLDPADGRAVQGYSGGERQRVAVARALAGDPDVLLADEPTASLDREAGDRLVHTLETLASTGGRTLIVVSHDPALIAAAGRVLRMVDGRIDPRVDERVDGRVGGRVGEP